MSFFEDLSQKATQASAKALEMTKGFSDAAMLKSTVITEEKKIRNFYSQIGEQYFTAHKDDYDDSYRDMIEGILISQKKIQECKEEIKRIKDIHYCEHCGAEVPNNAIYCSACHTPVPGVQSNPPTYTSHGAGGKCPKCGNMVPQGMKFCTFCGTAITAPQVETLTCSKCGANVNSTLSFCTKCGTRLK